MKRVSRSPLGILWLAIGLAVSPLRSFAQPSNCVAAPYDLVGIWRGDNNTSDTAGTNNGTSPYGISYANGMVGQAFDFDGSYRRVSIPDGPAFKLNSFTIEGWILPRALPSGFVFFRGDNRGGLDAWTLDLYVPGYLNFQIDDATNNYAHVLAPIQTNQWQHIAATLDDDTGDMKLYINGVLIAQTNTSVRPIGDLDPASDPAIGIGNHGGTFHQFPFNGLIDEISLYSRALSASEVQSIYWAGSEGKCATTAYSGVPAISGFAPSSAAAYANVTISGTNFSGVPADDTVYFGAARAYVTASSPTELQVQVPAAATYAPITVAVNGKVAYSSKPFQPTFAGNGSNISSNSFASSITLPAGDGPGRVVIADLDDDSRPDLIVANGNSHSISLYRNVCTNGILNASSFTREDLSAVPVSDSPYKVEVADVDGDGKPDLLAVNRAANTISVFRNISNGYLGADSFAFRVDFAVGALPLAVTVRDLDGDGRPEIITANYTDASVSVLKNIGTAGILNSNSFAPAITFPAGAGAANLICADLDDDNKPDIAVVNFDATYFSVLKNVTGPGPITFAPKVDFPAPANCEGIALGDLDGDGKVDLVLGASMGGQVISVARNATTPDAITTNSFAPRVDFPTAGWAHSVALGDLNGDGKPDIASVSESNSHLSVFQNASTPGTFTSASLLSRVDFASGWNPWGLSIGDLDGDGRPDVVFGNVYDGNITIYRNTSDLGNPTPDCAPAPAGLVSWWRGANNAADSVSGNNGTLPNGGSFVAGTVGTAFSFDGSNQCVQIPYSPNLVHSNFTVETWIKPSAQVNDPIGQEVIFGQSYGALQMVVRSGTTGVRVAWQFGTDHFNFYGTEAPADLPIGQFSHVAGTWDGVTLRLYINGVLSSQTSPGTVPVDSGCDFSIGGFYLPQTGDCQYVGQFFNGVIDDVSLYSRALSSSEIQDVYDAGAQGKCAPEIPAPYLIDIDFGAGFDPSPKTGFATLGYSTNDFWNFYTRDDAGGWRTFGSLANLRLVDTSITSVGMTVANGPGAWGNGSTDPMYVSYIYPFDGGNLTVTITNLPAGRYDVLPYCSDGAYEVSVNGMSYGIQHTYEDPVANPPNWTLGVQYARFTNVLVYPGQPLVLTARPGTGGYAVLSGMQILLNSTNIPVAPSISSQPTNRTIYSGGTAAFGVVASGDAPLAYQWLFNSSPLPGKTASVLSLANVQPTNAGNYSVVVTNSFGSVTSVVAVLTVELPPPCTPPPSELVSWWRFENSVADNWDSNDGMATAPTTFTAGKVGQALNLSVVLNLPRFVRVADSPSLRLTNALTLEAWINPVSLTGVRTIIAKQDYPFSSPNGSQSSFFFGTTNNGRLYLAVSASGSVRTNTRVMTTQPLPLNQWTLVSATYDGAALRLYTNGNLAATTSYSAGIFPGSTDLGIGGIPFGITSPGWPFAGLIDEVSIYNRALAADEIKAIYDAGITGKCLVAPAIKANPLSQAVPLGEDVQFTVAVNGSRPLRYQWRFNGNNILGATNAALVLEKIKGTSAGFYSVFVSNAIGTAISASAQLKLLPMPSCVTPPEGLISWWPLDGSGLDVLGGRNLQIAGISSYVTGKVDRAISFSGTASVSVPMPQAGVFDFDRDENFSIEGWVKGYSSNALKTSTTVSNLTLIEKRAGVQPLTGTGYSLSLFRGRLAFWMGGTPANTTNALFISDGPEIFDGMFHHLAVTVDRSITNGGGLYVDGQRVFTFNPTLVSGALSNSRPLVLPGGPYLRSANTAVLGDEIAIYRRALTADEIQSIAAAGAAGKCKVPPSIIIQPTNQTVVVGANVAFSVVAAGQQPLRYQWVKGGSPALLGATNATCNLTNVQSLAAGVYWVRVTNAFGSTLSSNALLVVNPAPVAQNRLLRLAKTSPWTLQFAGIAGQTYTIQTSTNLVDWTTIGTATDLGGGNFGFTDPDQANRAIGFYRIVQP